MMTPTHFLYLATPPRDTFVHDATPLEFESLNRHFAYMERLRQMGKLVLTGPTLDGAYGIAVFKVTAEAEAHELAQSDPCVIEGLFTYRLHPLLIGAVTP